MTSTSAARPVNCPGSHAPAPRRAGESELARRFRQFLDDPAFPCVGAKAALARGTLQIVRFRALGDRGNDAALLDCLGGFARMLDGRDPADTTLHSLVALFDGPDATDEGRFEALLWSQLQRLHDLDVQRGQPWSSDVSADPGDPAFSLSLSGHPFFVIGLHPGASRTARRFEAPALVFNSHRQFQALRADGRYAKMQKATRGRDMALQGTINPNLADYGTASEARQYSGRPVGPEWTCPLRVRRVR